MLPGQESGTADALHLKNQTGCFGPEWTHWMEKLVRRGGGGGEEKKVDWLISKMGYFAFTVFLFHIC